MPNYLWIWDVRKLCLAVLLIQDSPIKCKLFSQFSDIFRDHMIRKEVWTPYVVIKPHGPNICDSASVLYSITHICFDSEL